MKKTKVFISCGGKDIEKGKRLYGDLEKRGITAWMEGKDLFPGHRTKQVKNKVIRESAYFLALVSKDSISERGSVQADLRLAQNVQDEVPGDDIFIIPVLLDDCEPLDTKLQQLEPVDLFTDYDAGLDRLLTVLSRTPNSGKKKQIVSSGKSWTQKRRIPVFILPIIFSAVLAVLYFVYRNGEVQSEKPPCFAIDKPVMKPDDPIIIRSANGESNREEPLDIEFDEKIVFPGGGKPTGAVTKNGGTWREWRFDLMDHNPPDVMLEEKYHCIRAKFEGGEFSEKIWILFVVKPPAVRGTISGDENDPEKRIISGKVARNMDIPDNDVTVEVIYFHKGGVQEIDVPVKKVEDAGLIYYEFETVLQNLPVFTSGDPEYSEPFFGFKVTDMAGIPYFQEESYAKFMAPGKSSFGAGSLAQVEVKKIPEGAAGQFKSLIRLTPNPVLQKRLANGEKAIDLKVIGKMDNTAHLKWESRVPNPKPMTLVYENTKRIGLSPTNEYIVSKPKKEIVEYRVEQEDENGTLYTSDSVPYAGPGLTIDLKKIENRGRLYVISEPPDVEVKFEKGEYGFVQGMALPPGEYTIIVSKQDYKAENRTFTIKTGEKREEKFTLEREIKIAAEKNIVNDLGMEFVFIPPGDFMMGSPENEPARDSDEKLHKVVLTKGFYMQTTEVTQGQWKAVMGNNPSHFKSCGDNCPVESVSWNDAKEFIKKLNEREGKDIYRLPTEAEWEYSCRAGTDTTVSFGKCLSTNQANYDGNYPLSDCSKGTDRNKTVAVGSLGKNAWGLHDMHGNLWEWCEDWYGTYQTGTSKDPKGPKSGSTRLLRGGSWFNYAWNCRSAIRHGGAPDNRFNDVGFRLARSLP